jgi:hypothetical protein
MIPSKLKNDSKKKGERKRPEEEERGKKFRAISRLEKIEEI